MLNVLHGRFVANPAQNSPSHIMKGKKAQMSTVSHWDWIRHPHLTLLIHTRPRSPFLSLFHATRAHTSNLASSMKRSECTNIHLPLSAILRCSPTYRLVNLKYWFEGQRAVGLWEILRHSLPKITAQFLKICHILGFLTQRYTCGTV